MGEMTTKRSPADVRKHEQAQSRLLSSVSYFQKSGRSDEQIIEMVRSMMTFNRQWDEWQKAPVPESEQTALGFGDDQP